LPLVAGFVAIAAAVCMAAVSLVDGVRGALGIANFPPRAGIYAFSLLCVMLSLWLVLGQAFAYVTKGQAKKIEFIKGFFPPAVIAAYLVEFASGDANAVAAAAALHAAGADDVKVQAANGKLSEIFDDLLIGNFGIRAYALPSILFAVVAFIVLFIGYAGGLGYAESLTTKVSPVRPLGLTVDLVSVAAIFGAFTWIASDAITRNHQWTFHPSDLSWYSLRLIAAIPLGQAIAATWPGNGAVLAFVIGMFSLDRITAMLSSAAAKATGVPTSTPAERDDVVLTLPGVDEDNARALAAEGISTILQLKAIDPIRTSIRTGLPFEYILCLIDAALLWDFVGADLAVMRPFGFPGASYVLNYVDQERLVFCASQEADMVAGQQPQADPAAQAKGAVATKLRDAALVSKRAIVANPTTAMQTLWSAIEAKAAAASPKSKLDKTGLQSIFSAITGDDYSIFIRNMYNIRT
jgi:hypothetical protein